MPLFSGRCHSNASLAGKTTIITGCNTGIGKETVLDFYKRGAHVIMACRDLQRAEAAKVDVIKSCEGQTGLGSISVSKLDLGSLSSVKKCAEDILKNQPKIELLVNNAGVMMCPQGKTEDGFETQFGTNHLGHFLFTMLLLPRIIESKPARIVNVSSSAHEFGSMDFDDLNYEKRTYSPRYAYGQSKLSNVLFTSELSKKLKENNIEGVNVYSLHPGVVDTELGRHLDKVFFKGLTTLMTPLRYLLFKSAELGAQTTIYCSVDEKCANETGLYYSDCIVKTPSAKAQNGESAKKLWDVSMEMVGLKNFNPFKTGK